MRLRLIAQTPVPDGDKGWRLLERGELTLGRDPSCHWVLADPARTVSKVHCRIRRDATGFTVTDESTNGMSVDRRDLAQGESVRLSAGSVIAFCGQRFGVEITGEVEPDWKDPDARYGFSDEAPSITAILSDVSPGGTTARGILPGQTEGEDDGLAALNAAPPPGSDRPERASRPAIGWQEPIDMAITGGSRLPDDWDTDAATSTRGEHVVATNTRMRIPRPPGTESPREAVSPVPSGPTADDALAVFLREAGGNGALGDDPLASLASAGRSLREFRQTFARLDRGLAEFEDELGIAPKGGADVVAELVERQNALLNALRTLLAETDALDPARLAVQARVGATHGTKFTERLSLPGQSERAVLALLRRLYAGEDASSPRDRFTRALNDGAPPRSSDPAADDFVELSADRSRLGENE